MPAPLPSRLTPAAPHLRFAEMGPGFAALLTLLPHLSDAAIAALPSEWTFLPDLIATLILDEGLSTEMAAHEASLPASLVRAYRAMRGI